MPDEALKGLPTYIHVLSNQVIGGRGRVRSFTGMD